MNEIVWIWNLFFVSFSHLLHLKWMIFCCWSWLIISLPTSIQKEDIRTESSLHVICITIWRMRSANCLHSFRMFRIVSPSCFHALMLLLKTTCELKTPCTTQCVCTQYFVVFFFLHGNAYWIWAFNNRNSSHLSYVCYFICFMF